MQAYDNRGQYCPLFFDGRGTPMIYLDHAATSFPKPKGVIEKMAICMRNYCGNPGRSGHKMSMLMGEKIYETRKELAAFLGVRDPSRLLFTKNTTESLNLALFGYLKEGDHVVTTSMEHNSMLRPLKELESREIRHTVVKADSLGNVSADMLRDAVTDHTRLIAVTGASNVTGTILPLEEIGKMAKEQGIPLLVDGAQCIGKIPLHVENLGISFFAFPGHKGLQGPPGTGGLYVEPRFRLKPLLYGGTGTLSKSRRQPVDFPEGYEAGTVNGPAIIGFGQGVKAVCKVGVEAIAFYERELISYLEDMLRNMDGITCYGPESSKKTGICLFNIRGMSSEEVTDRLSRDYEIAVRGGFHCAGLAHETLGTSDHGAVRLSVGPFNTRKEIQTAAEAIWRLTKTQ